MNIAEVGVWKGEGAKQMAAHWPDATLWLIDSFAGHSEPCKFDDANAHPRGRYADTSIEEVRQKFPRAVIIAKYLPWTSIPAEFLGATIFSPPPRFRFVRIDLDHYLATGFACEFFRPLMEPCGVIEFDDYLHGETPGATKAIDEVFGRDNVLPGEGNFPTNSYHWVSP